MTAPRRIVVVDVESTGLDPARHVPLEVAWLDLTTGTDGCLLPSVSLAELGDASPDAMEINGYLTRGLHRQPAASTEDVTGLHRVLRGQVLAGSNPTFDAAMLAVLFGRHRLHPAPWHHRMLDLSAYAAGVLGLDVGRLPGLGQVCDLLGVTMIGAHTAAGDVAATAQCFRRLMAKAGTSPAEAVAVSR